MNKADQGSEKMVQKEGSAKGKKALLRLGVVALLALGVVGAVYLRQGTLSRPGVASEGGAEVSFAGGTEPKASLAQPEPPVVELPAGTDAEAVAELVPEIAGAGPEDEDPQPEGPVAVPESPKPLPKLLDLGADKCIPCKQMAPILDALRVEYAGAFEVVFIDVWKNPAEADKYKIRIIPTQIFYDANGKELFRHTGFYSKEQILAKWRQLGVDVGGR